MQTWRSCTAFLLLICGLAAQVVRIEAQAAYEGWTRATLDKRPPHRTGLVTLPNGDTVPYVVGRPFGTDAMTVDLHVALEAGQRVSLDLSRSTALPWKAAPLPDVLGYYGGLPEIAGVPMGLASEPKQDGAALATHWRARVAPMWCVDLWLLTYTDTPWTMQGEVRVTCSNPTVPDLSATVPEDFRLRFGSAEVHPRGRSHELPLIDAGTLFADGQCRAMPLTLVWAKRARDAYWQAQRDGKVTACGDVTLWPEGNPHVVPGLDVLAWTNRKLPGATALLHTFQRGIVEGYSVAMAVGVNAASGDTGEQQEQAFTCAEPLVHERALQVVYLSALKFACRPCHHLEADGSPLNHLGHWQPPLVLWDMRPHWHTGISPDRLGKAAGTLPSSGWWGADVEHALFSTLAAGARYTGSYALQAELGAIGRNYLFQWTIKPGLTTSAPHASRAIGWEGNLAVHLWRTLEDRHLAALIRQRWIDRFDFIIGPSLSAAEVGARGDVWTTHTNSQLGPGTRWQPWQQSVGADGLDRAGMVFGRPQARALALKGAKVVVAAYELRDGRWTLPTNIRLDGANDAGYGFYNLYGCPLASQVVLRHEPNDTPAAEKARAVWKQVDADLTQEKHYRWRVPGVR